MSDTCLSPSRLRTLYIKILISQIPSMSVVQVLQQEIKDSEISLSRTHEESVYKRDLKGLN